MLGCTRTSGLIFAAAAPGLARVRSGASDARGERSEPPGTRRRSRDSDSSGGACDRTPARPADTASVDTRAGWRTGAGAARDGDRGPGVCRGESGRRPAGLYSFRRPQEAGVPAASRRRAAVLERRKGACERQLQAGCHAGSRASGGALRLFVLPRKVPPVARDRDAFALAGREPRCGEDGFRPQPQAARGAARGRPSGDPLAAAGTTHSGACQGEFLRAVNTNGGRPSRVGRGGAAGPTAGGGAGAGPDPVWPPSERPAAPRSGQGLVPAATRTRRFAAWRRFAASRRERARRFGHTGSGAGPAEPHECARACCAISASPRWGRAVSGWIPRTDRGRGASGWASMDASQQFASEGERFLLCECDRPRGSTAAIAICFTRAAWGISRGSLGGLRGPSGPVVVSAQETVSEP